MLFIQAVCYVLLLGPSDAAGRSGIFSEKWVSHPGNLLCFAVGAFKLCSGPFKSVLLVFVGLLCFALVLRVLPGALMFSRVQ